MREIHEYPPRPPGFAEPLFPTPESRREVANHLLAAPWLRRASELPARTGTAAHVREEPVELLRRTEGVYVARARAGCRRTWRVVEVIERWREVRLWWSEDRVDRLCFRVAVAGGAIVDLARERSGGWSLVGVVD